MVVTITGGTGFIGSRLAARELERGNRVRVLGQVATEAERSNASRLAALGAQVTLGSVTDPPRVQAAVAGTDIVYHLAAAQHEAGVPDRHFWDVNLGGTRNVVTACLAAGVRRLVHASTIGVWAGNDGDLLDEDTPPNPDNIYGRTKLAGERAVLAAADRMPVVVVRISETYGPGDRRLLRLARAVARRRFMLIGDGSNRHHPIYIDDLVDGLLLAAATEAAVGGVFVLAGPDILTTREMVAIIGRQLGAPPTLGSIPLPPVLAAARLVEAVARPLGIRPPLHRRRVAFFVKSYAFSPQRAKDVLGFVPQTGFERGMAETLAWYREHGHLRSRRPAPDATR
ncbi:MAG TPA: NAD-dependent epimerase/dehydratase family protein [Candidatus Binatia bacterium]|nr:NAD-dependent epimerase/dehydratase family protein [Candidatus Binatia bacterium]